MLPVYKISVPTPYPVGPVNVCLIKSKPYTLIDTGPDTPASREALEDALAACRISIKDIERIVITHSHPDHCGLAASLRETTKAEVFVNSVEAGHLTGERDYFKEIFPFLVKAGVPDIYFQDIGRYMYNRLRRKMAKDDVLRLTGQEVLEFEGGELFVQNFPGHSQGHICLYDPQSKNFFSGDFLLPHITPNPLMEISQETGQRLPSKKFYIEGLARLLKMDIAEVWPGHGENIFSWRETVGEIIKHHQRRNDEVFGLLNKRGKTAYEIAVSMFPQIRDINIVMGVSEVLASLDILLEENRVYAEEGGEVILYYKAG